MANVPTVTAPTVTQSGAPLGINAPAGAFGASVVGEGLERVGSALNASSDMLQRHAEQFQTINNKTAADQAAFGAAAATQTWEESERSNNRKLYAQDPVGATQAAGQQIEQIRAKFREGLTNSDSQTLYDSDSRRNAFLALSRMSSFASSANTEWVTQTQTGVQKMALDEIAANPKLLDDTSAASPIARFTAAQATIDQKLGTPPELAQANLRESIGKAVGYIGDVMNGNGDPIGARDFVEKHKGMMSAGEYRNALVRLRPGVMASEAAADGDAAYAAGTSSVGGPVSVTPATGSRAARNNNPLNLTNRVTGVNWQGQTGKDGRFAQFSTPEAGFAAADQNLLGYGTHHGVDTIAGVIQRWAPSSENDTAAYISTVSKAVGIAPNAKIDLHDAGTRHAILTAMARVEGGPGTQVVGGGGQSTAASAGGPPTSYDLRATEPQIIAAAKAQAHARYPNNAAYEDTVVQRARVNLSQNVDARHATESGLYTEFLGSIIDNHTADLPALLSSVPDGRNKWNEIPAEQQVALKNYVQGVSNQVTPEITSNDNMLIGLYGNRSSNPNAFLNEDVTKLDLTPGLQRQWLMRQANFKAGTDKAATAHEMKIQSYLANPIAKNIYTALPNDRAKATFIGALEGRLDSLQLKEGQHPTQQQVQDAAQALVQDQVVSMGTLGFGRNILPQYNYVPPAAAKIIVPKLIHKLGHAPSADQIAYAYQRGEEYYNAR